jgi:hypothetical protein
MNEIVDKLRQLRELDPGFQIFGAIGHQYAVNQALTESEIAAFELKFGCRFPEQYRTFIAHVGNGGAGPFYGLFPLGMHDDDFDLCPWDKGSLLGDPGKPFRFNGEWNLSSDFMSQEPDPDESTSEEDEDRMWEEWDAKLEAEYWASDLMDGAIPICHEGCALRNWLVVTGPLAGTVWMDYRADMGGVMPCVGADGEPMSFQDWYLGWLDESISDARQGTA